MKLPVEFYHNFSILGINNRQRGGIYPINQRCKEQYILGYLLLALAKARGRTVDDRPSVLELFCADAYYGLLAKKFGAGQVTVIDNDPAAIEHAGIMRDILNLDVDIQLTNVFDFVPGISYDVVLCTGGLYHLSDPKAFLRSVKNYTKKYLIVQSVVSLESDDPEYFVSPAPGWPHGCRFSRTYFAKMLNDLGFQMIDQGFNHLEGNDRLCDRGSCYAFCAIGE